MIIDVKGTKGGVKLTYGGKFTFFGTKDGKLFAETPEYDMADMFYDELKAFVDCANANEKIRSHVDGILITAQMMDGLYASAEKGKEVSF